jgi:replicative DNA helicase
MDSTTGRKYPRKDNKVVDLDSLGREMGNVPPQALDLEEAVLAAMMIEPQCVDEAMENLNPDCFYDPKHRMIFEAMSALVNEHIQLDTLTVSQKLKELGNLEEIGGSVALANMSQKVGSAAHVDYYIQVLRQKTIQRDLISAAFTILREAYDPAYNVDNLIDDAQTKVYDAIKNNVRRDVHEVGSIVNDVMDWLSKEQNSTEMSGVPSGYPRLDEITQGWQPSDLIILAARPSVGKTAFALNIARNAAVDYNIPVAIFSLEMPESQLVKRLMTTESGLDAKKIKGGVKMTDEDWKQLDQSLAPLVKSPLYIDDTPSLPIMEFRTKAKRLVKSKGVRLLIVDYLQLMQGPSELRGMREQEVAAISRTLKATAKELDVPIIALSQLSRNAVQRQGSNGKPQLSDLRESGSIEQDADMVIFVHRPDYVGLSDNPGDKEKTQLIIAKHRNGETGEINLRFKGDQIRFVEDDDTLTNAADSMMQQPQNFGSSYNPFEDEFQQNGF